MPDGTQPCPAQTTLDTATSHAVDGFLLFYDGHTRATYAEHLRILLDWCTDQQIAPLDVTRLQLEQFARHLVDKRGNCVGTVKRRMNAVARFYALAAADGLIATSPAVHVRLPRQYPDSDRVTDVYLTRFELAAMLTQAKQRPPVEAALVALLGLMGLRVGEACALTVPAIAGHADGHRVLRFTGKGAKPAVLPIPIPVLRLLTAAAGGRDDGPLLVRATGRPLNPRAAARILTRLTAAAGIDKHVTPHTLRRSFASAGLDAGVSLRDMQTAGRWADTRMVALYDRARFQLDRSAVHAISAFVAAAG